jgi:probable RNA-binding protein EIF1AD
MGRSKRNLLQTAAAAFTPPDVLPENHILARVVKAEGNNLFRVEISSKEQLLVELPAKFRSEFWIKRRGYVVVDRSALADRENKLGGEISNVVREEKAWRKMKYWPAEFSKRVVEEDSDEDESNMGKMPPSDSEEEG